mmetsp:Transcript_44068/g.110392  ORF Transcript_44068/g.110392 Transcript_44068/m.110392 type:complete len:261 (+) Transcript_44068:86-868(+)|eukprot:CAMPEP_0173435260 /NCGR_PEP_ID=MMETSP1357-20121228/14606_1 /TAXON_ID=77926 /ORGANISM="Hemiselmis rufescens, Strain PCC563" /LENGTH=260 /DNA_ID=CAMNT_0014400219 /DNA_START=90 /DNA_END=872 /DNA_ORIENTATION=+
MGLLGVSQEEVASNLEQGEAGAAAGSIYDPQPPTYPPPPHLTDTFPASSPTVPGVADPKTELATPQATYTATPMQPTAPSMVPAHAAAAHAPANTPPPVMVMATPVPSRGRWGSGLFMCCGDPGGVHGCMMASFCPCVVYGSIHDKLSPDEAICGGSFAAGCLAHCLCGGCITMWNWFAFLILTPLSCSHLVHTSARTALRKRYGIPGTECIDCCIVFWCEPCALVQERKELKLRNQWSKLAPTTVASVVTVPNAANAMR